MIDTVRSCGNCEEQKHDEKRRQTLQRQIYLGISIDDNIDLLKCAQNVKYMKNIETVSLIIEQHFTRVHATDFVALCETIGALPKVRTLRIRSGSFQEQATQFSIPALVALLRKPVHDGKSCLQSLQFTSIDFLAPSGRNDMHDLAKAFGTHGQSLSCIQVEYCSISDHNTEEQNGPEPAYYIENEHPLLKVLEHCNNLKRLCIKVKRNQKVSSSFQHAVIQIVQNKNFTLESLEMDQYTMLKIPQKLRRQLRFYLSLNRTGLRHLLLQQSSTSPQWVDAITAHKYDTSIIYYLLSNHPTIISGY